jgi:hypothetical protein
VRVKELGAGRGRKGTGEGALEDASEDELEDECGGGGDAENAVLYRAVRGHLPKSFWLLDSFGHITATDFGFMSTSTDRKVCELYAIHVTPL